ncbi:MAG TPA: hypothetical protein PLN33_06465 [Hyphomonadaceae bacterium]|nr:hypothetical protein [Hyphomonadaceae bacterium]HPN04406.1 hypothetical protein [Hyphomonadaceae bacterium]
MDIATMVVVIVLVVLGFSLLIVKWGLAHEEKRMAMKATGGADFQRMGQMLAATQTEMAGLRERVQVLERLATDDDSKLASDIERLRSAETMRG